MPSTPSYPRERPSAQLPAARREYESFDNYESARIVLAASTIFQRVIEFSGQPESVIIDASAAAVDVRFSNPGESPPNAIRLEGAGERRFQVRARLVEARDPAGAGGQGVTATGRYASRDIDIRTNRPGPSRERPMLDARDMARQVPTTE